MIGYYGNDFVAKTDVRLVREYGFFIVLGILLSIPISNYVKKKTENKVAASNLINVVMPIVYGLAFIWAISFALLGYHNPFMYQQF